MAGHALANHSVDPVTGRKRYTGIKKNLKGSQTIGCTKTVQFTNLVGHRGYGVFQHLCMCCYPRRYTRAFGVKVAGYFRESMETGATWFNLKGCSFKTSGQGLLQYTLCSPSIQAVELLLCIDWLEIM